MCVCVQATPISWLVTWTEVSLYSTQLNCPHHWQTGAGVPSLLSDSSVALTTFFQTDTTHTGRKRDRQFVAHSTEERERERERERESPSPNQHRQTHTHTQGAQAMGRLGGCRDSNRLPPEPRPATCTTRRRQPHSQQSPHRVLSQRKLTNSQAGWLILLVVLVVLLCYSCLH